MDDPTRVFFVTTSSDENEELHTTLEEAEHHLETMKGENAHIAVAIVRNSFQEEDGTWNYDDHSNTFEWIKTLTPNE